MANAKAGFLQRLFNKIVPGSTQTYQRAPEPKFLDSKAFQPKGPSSQQIKDSIAINETGIIPKGKKYSFRQPAGNREGNEALGKYQITSDELASYGERFLGRSISPNEFIKNPTAQETYMDNKIKRYADEQYTPSQIADIHRRGFTNSSDPGSDVYQDPGYVEKFMRNINQ